MCIANLVRRWTRSMTKSKTEPSPQGKQKQHRHQNPAKAPQHSARTKHKERRKKGLRNAAHAQSATQDAQSNQPEHPRQQASSSQGLAKQVQVIREAEDLKKLSLSPLKRQISRIESERSQGVVTTTSTMMNSDSLNARPSSMDTTKLLRRSSTLLAPTSFQSLTPILSKRQKRKKKNKHSHMIDLFCEDIFD